MNQNDTRRLIDAYGADPSRWPVEAQLAEVDPAVLDDARRLDAVLAGLVPVAEDHGATERVMARLDRLPAQSRSAWSLQGWSDWLGDFSGIALWPRVAALATASVLGVMIGLSDLAAPIVADDEPDDLIALVLEQPTVAGLED